MKIESIETFLADQVAIVRIRTNDGAEGIGQTSPYRAGLTVRALHEMAAAYFLGQDPWDLEALVERCVRGEYKFPSSFLYRALCGMDTALWDLLGKVTGQPVYKLLGGQVRDAVPMYASSMSRSITPEAEAERLLRLREEHGFRCAKIRIGDVMADDRDASPGRTEKLIPHIRTAMGDDFHIHADANSGFSVSRAIRVGRILEDNGYFHFEEPCPYPLLENTAQVAAALDIPVAGGEQDNSLVQFRRMIQMNAVDIVQPDIGYIGGVARARRVARMAEDAGIPCTPHCANQSMLQVFTLHLAASMPACFQYHEWSIEDTQWTRGIYEPALEVVDGAVPVPTAPGWGVEVTPYFLRNAHREVSTAT
ncbi:mandelate racemase/muconate lactonizing enzyme family protein [Actinopolymorpha alba]|uniref:mandelate racemase/muconate lactonizing enzyme family protein n=1 Tax=Actinopolymorpha alba TaxID=533267 RepID=UPI0003788A55|nr:mandelate racemase/muconate lactonizing enzyme family protein [Actinopolymorpha alba]